MDYIRENKSYLGGALINDYLFGDINKIKWQKKQNLYLYLGINEQDYE